MVGAPGLPARIAFYLLPRFSLLAFSSAVEPLRMANRLSSEPLYQWSLIAAHGPGVASSNGLVAPVDLNLADGVPAQSFDAVFVCAGESVHRVSDEAGLQWLRQLDRAGVTLGGICTGTHFLARADVLGGYRSTIHWENLASTREEFPSLVISAELFEVDRNRYTCAGGTAPMDMMLWEIRHRHGVDLATRVAEEFMCDRIRDRHDRQRVPLTRRIGASQPKLAEAVSLMEANIEEPMSLDEVAVLVGVSRRQLERLFKRYLQVVPTRYYLKLRLERGRQLLLQTSMPIVDVAMACGFISAPHFSKCYRDAFTVSPRDERQRAAGTWQDGADCRV